MCPHFEFSGFEKRELTIIRSSLHDDPHFTSRLGNMHKFWNASSLLVLRVALPVLLITGCGIATTKAPSPVATGSSADATPLTTAGLQLGYLWEKQSRSFYPVLGVAGSAHYGSPIAMPGRPIVTAAAVSSPGGSWSLALRSDGTLQVLTLPDGNAITLANGIAADTQITLSPVGSAAALSSKAGNEIAEVVGLPTKPTLTTVALAAGRSIAGIAISDSGTILVGLSQAGAPAIELGVASPTRSYSAISKAGGWGGAAFGPGSAAANSFAVFVDSQSSQLTLVDNPTAAAPALTHLSSAGLLQKPDGVGISADGKWAMVADASKAAVFRISIRSGGAPVAMSCACVPKGMTPMTSDGVFALTAGISGQPLWILDTRPSEPRSFFVPGVPTNTAKTASSSQTTEAGR